MNEELGINAVAPLGRVLLCTMTEPTAEGFCPFRVLVGANREIVNEKMCGFGCWRIENAYTSGHASVNKRDSK